MMESLPPGDDPEPLPDDDYVDPSMDALRKRFWGYEALGIFPRSGDPSLPIVCDIDIT